jgi:hypothetical protein
MEMHWFPVSKEVKNTEVIKQGVGICLLGQRWKFTYRLPGKGYNHQSKILHCTSQLTEAASGLQTSSKLSKGILYLQDNVSLHKAAIMHQKLEDVHF